MDCDPDEDDEPEDWAYPDTPEVDWSPPAVLGVILDHLGGTLAHVEEHRPTFGYARWLDP